MRSHPVRVALAAALGALYVSQLREPHLLCGATDAEADARLPGDALLEDAACVATRAVEIDAPARAVWPWLVQTARVPKVGDTIGLGPNLMRLELVDTERVLATRSADGNWVWTIVLVEHDGKTRLISRNRYRRTTRGALIGMLAMEPASSIMERRLLAGIKRRAERIVATTPGASTSTVAVARAA